MVALEDLGAQLCGLLEKQVADFAAASQLQSAVNLRLAGNKDVAQTLEDLRRKEALLDGIRARTAEFQPFIALWMQSLDEVKSLPEYPYVQIWLDRLDEVVRELRNHDDLMIGLVQSRDEPTDPQLLIHAFRALS